MGVTAELRGNVSCQVLHGEYKDIMGNLPMPVGLAVRGVIRIRRWYGFSIMCVTYGPAVEIGGYEVCPRITWFAIPLARRVYEVAVLATECDFSRGVVVK